MPMKFKNYLFLALLFFTLSYAGESKAFMQHYETDKVKATLLTGFDEINPRQNLDVIVKFEMKNGWHIFAQNPGDIGIPTTVTWQLPTWFELGPVEWSRFQRFETEGIVQYGYDKTAYYRTSIKPYHAAIGRINFRGQVSWLACKDECIPEKFDFSFTLPVTKKDMLVSQDFAEMSMSSQKMFQEHKTDIEDQSFLGVMLMAFLGGLILNFMPCVFPILTLKAVSLAQGTYNKIKCRIEALIYFAGVVSSFMLMATLLLWFRHTGEEIGWGFQLQSPIFVAIMIVVFSIIFLMLLDVVNVNNPFANKVGRISFAKRRINAFVTGFFAVLVASPCTAPFMGIAIGYTLSQPLYIFYPIFLSLSIGYALPFTLAGFYPKAVHKILPKPGKWMEIFKKIFAIPVFLTVVWLVWVLFNQLQGTPQEMPHRMNWQKYDTAKVETLVQDNQKVFIDFTAKWCITCLVNKKLALQSETFGEIVTEKNIHLFMADWTNHDEEISKALQAYGRNSIPLYIYYDGHGNDYKILPQLLTEDILKKELN